MFPNISFALSIFPFPFRSRTNHASSEPGAVHDTRSFWPVPKKSKSTPFSELVIAKPLSRISMITGVPLHSQVPELQTAPSSQIGISPVQSGVQLGTPQVLLDCTPVQPGGPVQSRLLFTDP